MFWPILRSTPPTGSPNCCHGTGARIWQRSAWPPDHHRGAHRRDTEHEAAVKESTQAITLNPSNAFVQGQHGAVLTFSGRPGEGLPYFQQAMRLSPLDPLRWHWVWQSSNAHYFHGDYAACVAAGRDVCRMQPDLVFGYRAIVIALAELGRIEEARQYADVIYSRFNSEMRLFLSTRMPGWRAADYAAIVASHAKAGLVLRDGVLLRVS